MDGEFLTLAAESKVETRVRGSTFVACALPAGDEAGARAGVEAWARPRHDATHHCTAWRFRDGRWRVNDDGEPAGSAGSPILAAIDGAGLRDVLVIVTRYFGGTKLGVGGLIRAYGDAAALALEAAPRRLGVVSTRLAVEYGYEHTSIVMRLLEQFDAAGVEHGHAAGGARGRVECSVPAASAAAMAAALVELSAGGLAAEPLGEHVVYRDTGGPAR